jgi:hypothetical protein
MEKNSTTFYDPGHEHDRMFWALAGELEPVRHDRHVKTTDWTITQVLGALAESGVTVETLFEGHTAGKPEHLLVRLCTEEGTRVPCLLLLTQATTAIVADFACSDEDDLQFWVKLVLGGIPEAAEAEVPEGSIRVGFTYSSEYGPRVNSREIEAPAWEDIKGNYARSGALEDLLEASPENFLGHLGILHGVPGVGKTTFLRALARSWKEKAYFSYVVDAEVFFNDPGYLLGILMNNNHGDKWHVVICEDAEEFIAPDAKAEVGQALSRLLNLGDGMLGQGLKVLFLFTTNKPDNELAPAITRPGRCFANLEIPAFGDFEGRIWLKDHGVDPYEIVPAERTLAELYEVLRKG